MESDLIKMLMLDGMSNAFAISKAEDIMPLPGSTLVFTKYPGQKSLSTRWSPSA